VALAALLSAAGVLAAAGVARADGAFPDSLSLLVPADRPHRISLATNFGLISSNDDGGTWSWVCEGPITNCSMLYSVGAAPADRLFALSADSLVFSDDDACEWTVAGGDVAAGGVVDAFPFAQDATRVLAAVSPNGVGAATTYTVVESHDGGSTFDTVLYTAMGGDLVTGVEASRTDADTIYVTLAAGEAFSPALALTTDGGVTWHSVDLSAALGASSGIRLVAVDRTNPMRAFLRVAMPTAEGLGVFDATTGAVTVPVMFPMGGLMTGFVQTAEGPLVVAGRVNSDAGAAFRSLDGGQTWQPVSGAPHVRALAERDGTVYVAADNTADGYAVGVSKDLGVTFDALMRFNQVGSIAACVRAACQTICNTEVSAGLWPASMCAAAPEAPKAAGGGCATGGAPRPSGVVLVVALLMLAVSRRR
jgi:MYXO-CTERM domain-containing protein